MVEITSLLAEKEAETEVEKENRMRRGRRRGTEREREKERGKIEDLLFQLVHAIDYIMVKPGQFLRCLSMSIPSASMHHTKLFKSGLLDTPNFTLAFLTKLYGFYLFSGFGS